MNQDVVQRRRRLGARIALTLTTTLALPAIAGASVTFAPALGSPFGPHLNPTVLTVADINGDGPPDFVTASFAGDAFSMLLDNGAGGFAIPDSSPHTVADPTAIAVADVNHDGSPDFAVTTFGGSAAGTVTVFYGDGGGGTSSTIARRTISLGPGPDAVGIADFNADGNRDLAVADAGGTVTVLLGDGVRGFAVATGSPFAAGVDPGSLVVADVNGDGKPDLVLANGHVGTAFSPATSDSVSVLLGTGNGSFTSVGPPIPVGGAGRISMAVADVNGDGKPDIATTNGTGVAVSVLLGTGDGSFTSAPGSPVSVAGGTGPVVIADVNGDDKPDIATVSGGDGDVSLLLGSGNGGFAPAPGPPLPAGGNPGLLATADVNGDADSDLALGYPGGGVSVLLNTSPAAHRVSATGTVAFGRQAAGTSSAAQTVTLTSTGDGRLHPSGAHTTSADFLVAQDDCAAAALALGETCSVKVRFAPQASGAKSATLVIDDNAPGGPATVPLTGTGDPPLAGPAGPTGPTGATGSAGAHGAPGPAGDDGADGVKGVDGVNGVDGANGTSGADGPAGLDGPVGSRGPTTTVTCKARPAKHARKVVVRCKVVTRHPATARLTDHGVTVAIRHVKAGRRRVTFELDRRRRHGAFRLHLTLPTGTGE